MSKSQLMNQGVVALLAGRMAMLNDLLVVLEAIKDTSIPLDDRWDAFTVLVTNNIFVKNERYGIGFVDSPYDDLNMERGCTKNFVDAYEMLEDRGAMSVDELDNWRDKVLASGYASFTYDW